VVAEHNRNAERIRSIRGKASLTVVQGGHKYPVDGRLALERPKNFCLNLTHVGREVADIGSNDEKFWFWVRDSKEKNSYFCNYDEAGGTPLVATMQPDWIVEALGLRVIPAEEIGEVSVKRGSEPGTLVLTHSATKAGSESVVRETIISESTQRIKEHRLYSSGKKTLLARAKIQSYLKVVPEDGESGADAAVYLPENLTLEWLPEQLSMTAKFDSDSTKVNVDFESNDRQALFVERRRRGYTPINLAERAGIAVRGAAPADDTTTIRRSRPAPRPGVDLDEPEPIGTDEAQRDDDGDSVAMSSNLPKLGEDLVAPAIPQAPEIQFAPPDNSGGRRAAPIFEQR
jgi:hypothetical protein